ncbi:MAG: hypothetical protein ABR582_11225 [Gemmatimonadaceae bacterium]
MRFTRKVGLYALMTPLVVVFSIGGLACVFQKPEVQELDQKQSLISVRSPVKAHLLDGSTVIYSQGLQASRDLIVTGGMRYKLGSASPFASGRIALDSIVGMETFDTRVNTGKSVAASIALTPVVVVGTAAALVAIFGSCPTFYVDSAGTQVLQSEGFSYSIAPLFEQRDVDRLRVTPTRDGRVILYVRNEALETHYINNLELLEVSHDPGEMALPDQHGLPIAVKNMETPGSIVDRAGENISSIVRSSDGQVFSTADETLRHVSETDVNDYIDLTVAAPRGADSVAIVLDMRNSLLNTVLLYDEILGNPGLRSLDYLGKDLDRISNVVDLGRWYAARMGMHISVRDGNGYRQVARIGDSGPIAFHETGVLVPAVRSGGDSVHVRLSFVADDWRIDAIHVSSHWRRPISRVVPISRVKMRDPNQNSGALESLRNPDDGYLITNPGEAFSVEFDVRGIASASRTYLLASQGYYTEWVRGSWIKRASGKPFTPTDAALVDAIHAWRAKQAHMEQQFYSTRISAR